MALSCTSMPKATEKFDIEITKNKGTENKQKN